MCVCNMLYIYIYILSNSHIQCFVRSMCTRERYIHINIYTLVHTTYNNNTLYMLCLGDEI